MRAAISITPESLQISLFPPRKMASPTPQPPPPRENRAALEEVVPGNGKDVPVANSRRDGLDEDLIRYVHLPVLKHYRSDTGATPRDKVFLALLAGWQRFWVDPDTRGAIGAKQNAIALPDRLGVLGSLH